ncbi:MAG: hypothetical protein ABSC54_11430 [Smithellaceae bacterium]|jgi:hypothetical protein
MIKYLFAAILVLITFISLPVYAQNDEDILSLYVEGSAKIKQNDVVRARKEAIQDALEKAILKAVSKLLAVPTKDEKFQQAKNIIINEQDKYVQYYKIAEEKRQAQNFIVNANVVLALSSLKDDLHKMGFLQTAEAGKNNIKVSLSVIGLKKYSDYLNLKDFLQNRTKLVKNIYPCNFQWSEAHCEIEMSGDAKSFADELVKNAACVPDIKQTDSNKIEMICLKNMEEK